jgi:phage regulator Rha-like protein
MKRTFALMIGIGAGVALTAAVASTRRGREVRSQLVKKAEELRHTLANSLEEKARNIHESEVSYS